MVSSPRASWDSQRTKSMLHQQQLFKQQHPQTRVKAMKLRQQRWLMHINKHQISESESYVASIYTTLSRSLFEIINRTHPRWGNVRNGKKCHHIILRYLVVLWYKFILDFVTFHSYFYYSFFSWFFDILKQINSYFISSLFIVSFLNFNHQWFQPVQLCTRIHKLLPLRRTRITQSADRHHACKKPQRNTIHLSSV